MNERDQLLIVRPVWSKKKNIITIKPNDKRIAVHFLYSHISFVNKIKKTRLKTYKTLIIQYKVYDFG